MARQERLKLTLSGDLARALAWEGGRRGQPGSQLALELLELAAAATIAQWRDNLFLEARNASRPNGREIQTVQAVLSKAYGPRGRKRQAPRTLPRLSRRGATGS